MEFDCEIFDDGEAALDALLETARWPDADVTAVDRLAARVVGASLPAASGVSIEGAAPREVNDAPVVIVAERSDVHLSAAAAADVDPAQGHGDAFEFSREPIRMAASGVSHARLPGWVGVAACLLLAMNIVWIILNRGAAGKSPAVAMRTARRDLPGRAPSPMELWAISPAAQKWRLAGAQSAADIDPHARRIAIMCSRADASALAKAALVEVDPASKDQLFAALMRRPDGMDRYLELILNRRTQAAAVNLLAIIADPPMQKLVAELDGPRVAHRLAAARALGQLCHGQTVTELKRMIERGDHRREALAVLSQCKDPAASQYILDIRKQASLGSEFNVVNREMAELF